MQRIITINLGGVNCYLLNNNEKYALIDTGGHMFMDKEYSDRRALLNEKLIENGVDKTNLELVILTHGDCDHVFNANFIHNTYNARIAMHSDDVWMVNEQQTDSYKVNSKYESKAISIVFKMMRSKIDKLMCKVNSEFETFTPDILLSEGSTLVEYGFDGTIFSTPGHTKGSICILDSNGNLICGDLFANNRKPSIAVNAEDFVLLKLQARRILKKEVKQIFPGHGASFTIMSAPK